MAQEQPAPFPDTAHFLDAANDSARHFRAVYTTYLLIASYIFFTIVSTDDELLFRNGNVQMPIIDTGMSIAWFFTLAPWILFLLHFNVLMQAMFLSTKVNRYTSRFAKEKIHERGLLFPAPLAHLLSEGDRRRGVKRIWRIVVFISLVLLPPIILIYAEIHFLTYQNELITWWHRIVILLDIIMQWRLWPRIITSPDTSWKEWWGQSTWKRRTGFASVATGIFVFVIADIPGGTMENFIPANALRDWLEPGLDRKYQLEERILVQEEPSPEILAAHLVACKSQNPDDRTDCQAEIKPGTPIWCQYAKPLPLQERAFRQANLQKAVLCGIDLSVELSFKDKMKLVNASLSFDPNASLNVDLIDLIYLIEAAPSVDLSGADLSKAKLHGADLRNTKLQGTDLSEAELQGADLLRAKLQDTDLGMAKLQGADLRKAELQGADLRWAKLQGADLRWAELQGADLRGAKLQGTDLRWAKLQGADLRWAELQGADLRGAKLQGADLLEAKLQGADLRWAKLQGAYLREAELQGAYLREAELQGAYLRWAYLAGSDLSNANLKLADLRDVDLESKPDQEQLQKAIAIIKSIKQRERRDQALELVKRAETEEATIAPSSIEDAIFSEGSALYKQLQESENRELLRTRHFTQTWEDGYDTKLAAYLIDSLSCGDEDSYVAEGIIRYRILVGENRKLTSRFAEKLNLYPKVPSLLCQGVEKSLDGLSEKDRTTLRVLFVESANQ